MSSPALLRTEAVVAVTVVHCGANEPLRRLLQTTGLMHRLGKDHVYPLVRAAMAAYHAHFGAPQMGKFTEISHGTQVENLS